MTLEEFLKQDKPEQFDMKKNLMHDYYNAYESKHKNDKAYQAMLKRTEQMSKKRGVALWYDYKTADENYTPKKYRFDCDSSNETNDLMNEVYALLWWNEADKWGIDKDSFGSDTMNSFATTFNALMQKNNHKESYAAYVNETETKMSKKIVDAYAEHTGYLGNFTLVPRGYNTARYNSFKDYWDLSLDALRREETVRLDDVGMDFNRYINTFFLWDYVGKTYHVRPLFAGHGPLLRPKDHILPRRYEQGQVNEFDEFGEFKEFMSNANRNIERRGSFMVAMLRIAKASADDWKTIIHALATSERLGEMQDVLALLAKLDGLQDGTKAILQDALSKLNP